ncbi:MAG: NAD(P)/FAD-dependent oxidoreductase [Verrucomicrobiota bacterium]
MNVPRDPSRDTLRDTGGSPGPDLALIERRIPEEISGLGSILNQVKSMKRGEILDVVIVGAGPVGLGAAMLLGRCMRKVVLIDSASDTGPSIDRLHGSKEDDPPDFSLIDRDELHGLETVKRLHTAVDNIERSGVGFIANCRNRTTLTTRTVLLVSDIKTRLPQIPGAEKFYGSSLHQCPYSHGWEHRGKPLGVLGSDETAVALALKLLLWSHHVTLFTNGDALKPSILDRLAKGTVEVVTDVIQSLEGRGRNLQSVLIEDGSPHRCEALFFTSHSRYPTSIASRLGCNLRHIVGISNRLPEGETGIQGLFVAGDPSHNGEMPVLATADGIKAGEAINSWLLEADHSYLAV